MLGRQLESRQLESQQRSTDLVELNWCKNAVEQGTQVHLLQEGRLCREALKARTGITATATDYFGLSVNLVIIIIFFEYQIYHFVYEI